MADPLSMSLDQIIEKNNASRSKEGKGGGGLRNRGNKNKVARSARGGGKKQFSDRPKTARPSFLSRDVEGDSNTPSFRPATAPKLIYRPIKVVSASQSSATKPSAQPKSFATSGVAAPLSKSNNSVFARLGKTPQSGTKVIFSSLVSSVEPGDMEELCKTVGEIKDIVIKANWSGQKSAEVIFARRSDAVSCVSKFNGLTLDGVSMVVELADEPAAPAVTTAVPKTIFDRITAPSVSSVSVIPAAEGGARNNREGLFGTAIVDDDDEEMQEDQPHRRTTFSVTLGAGGGGSARTGRAVVVSNRNGRNGGGDRERERGGRQAFEVRGARGVKGKVGKGGKPDQKMDDNLDDDLDAYMKKR